VYRVDRHVWRTEDGRLVPDGDPDAAFLAYPAGTEFSDEEAARIGLTKSLSGHTSQLDTKAAAKPADKAATPQRDKGLTVTRSTTPKE
jgi:hypothetical protein